MNKQYIDNARRHDVDLPRIECVSNEIKCCMLDKQEHDSIWELDG